MGVGVGGGDVCLKILFDLRVFFFFFFFFFGLSDIALSGSVWFCRY